MEFIDSHSHLDTYADEIPAILQKMRTSGVRAISIGTHANDWLAIRQLAKENPDLVAYTAGLHPTEVKETWKRDIEALEKLLEDTHERPCGLGEFGLDFYRLEEHHSPREQAQLQRMAFHAQIAIANTSHLPVVIHSRGPGAYAEILKTLDEAKVDFTKYVFHCFSEGPNEIRELNARGARASFTGIITFKNGQLMRDALLAQAPSLLMFETDAPFLAPEPHRGKRNDPSLVPLVAAKAAELYGIPLSRLTSDVFTQTVSFFGLPWLQQENKSGEPLR